jgi:hypothetical protein
VFAAAKSLKPKPIQKWACVVPVNGEPQEYPVKQLFLEAANRVVSASPKVTPADFISHSAVARLKRLRFEVNYYG